MERVGEEDEGYGVGSGGEVACSSMHLERDDGYCGLA